MSDDKTRASYPALLSTMRNLPGFSFMDHLTHDEALKLLTPTVRKTLSKFDKKDAYTPECLQEQGIPAPLVHVLVVRDNARAEAARVSLSGRKRVETQTYVWGPDIQNFIYGLK